MIECEPLAIRTVNNPQYELECDQCGKRFTSTRGRTAYSLRWLLARNAREAGWTVGADGDTCPDCRKKGE